MLRRKYPFLDHYRRCHDMAVLKITTSDSSWAPNLARSFACSSAYSSCQGNRRHICTPIQAWSTPSSCLCPLNKPYLGLQMYLAKVGIFSSALHGSFTMEARERMTQEFQLDDDHLCIQLSNIPSQYDAIPTVIKIAWFLEGC